MKKKRQSIGLPDVPFEQLFPHEKNQLLKKRQKELKAVCTELQNATRRKITFLRSGIVSAVGTGATYLTLQENNAWLIPFAAAGVSYALYWLFSEQEEALTAAAENLQTFIDVHSRDSSQERKP